MIPKIGNILRVNPIAFNFLLKVFGPWRLTLLFGHDPEADLQSYWVDLETGYISFFAWSSFSSLSSVRGSSWYGLNWLFTTSMSSSSTETSTSSSLINQWKHTIHNHLTCCFASETLLSDQSVNKSCPQHHVTRMKLHNKLVPVSWPFFHENLAVLSAKMKAKFCFGELKRLQSFYLHIGGWNYKKKNCFIRTLRAAFCKFQLSSFGREKMKFLKLSQMKGLDKWFTKIYFSVSYFSAGATILVLPLWEGFRRPF